MGVSFSESLCLALLLLVNSSVATRIGRTNNNSVDGFSLNLVHRQSPHSPLHDPSLTPYHHAQQMLRRSASRHRYLSYRLSSSQQTPPPKASGGFDMPVTKDPGEYVMKFGVGTPLQEYWGILDTGSDLLWIQCLPCADCFNQTDPIFDPHKSSTYKPLGCKSKTCSSFENGYCNEEKICKYSYGYNDQSRSVGTLGVDTLGFHVAGGRRKVEFPSVAFGCGNRNQMGGIPTKGTGVFGLGRGSLSVVTQLGDPIEHKFSYCFRTWTDTKAVGRIDFGSEATYSGTGKLQSTPITGGERASTNYYISLVDISVGSKRLHITQGSPMLGMTDGGMIIDSGTTLTFLSSDVYGKVASAIKEVVKFPIAEGPPDWTLCFKVKDSSTLEGLPEMTFHFAGGADWRIPVENGFAPMSETVICSTLHPSNSGLSIFGNLAQQNYHVEYDLKNNKLNFAETDCSKGN